jgi:hypothetical protein
MKAKWNSLISKHPESTADVHSSKSERDNNNSDMQDSERNEIPQALPRLPKKTVRHTEVLSRSLLGELVVTPSSRNLILADDFESDDGDDINEDTNGTSAKDVDAVMEQRQFTISKKKNRVSR